MAHANRLEQLEDLRNVTTHEQFYEKLAAGQKASSSLTLAPNGSIQHYIPVPITIKAQLGNPVC